MRINKYLIPCVVIIIILLFKKNIIPGFVIIFAHEAIHLAAARFMGFSGFTIDILPVGTSLKFKELDEATPREDIIVSLAGPVGNAIIAVLLFGINIITGSRTAENLAVYNMIICVFNLIPAFPLDGGRVLRDILNLKYIYKKANRIALNVSMIIGCIFGAIFLLLIGRGIFYIDLGVFAVFILFVSYKEKRRIAYLIMGYILKKREKLINRGYLENKSLSVYFKLNMLQLVELVDKNKYNEFIVLDNNMKVIGVLYEQDIICALKELGNITLEELISIRSELG